MSRSVLRVADQEAQRLPDVCVLTGEPTNHATRITATEWNGRRWLLGVPGFVTLLWLVLRRERFRVALPVSEQVWTMWRRRSTAAVVIAAGAVGFLTAGTAQGTPLLIAVGVIGVVTGLAYRTKVVHDYWVTCRLRAGEGTIIVEPTNSRFDAQARAIFVRSI